MTGRNPVAPPRPAGRAGADARPTGAGTLHAMFVHAHPDDESSKGAATVARYRREGHRVSVVTCTDGSRGDILNPAMDRPGVRERLTEIRREELARALAILGVDDHFGLGYADSGYVDDPAGGAPPPEPGSFSAAALDEATERLVAIIRAQRPDVLVTYPPGGDYPHADHVRCHDVSVAAWEAAGDPGRYPDAGRPWQVRKLYYVGAFSRRKVAALHAACAELGLESPFAGWSDEPAAEGADTITTSVEVGDHLPARSRALMAHATQIDPDGPWFVPPDAVVRAVYPYEDFVLAGSLVPTALPEDSLFAGLEPAAAGRWTTATVDAAPVTGAAPPMASACPRVAGACPPVVGAAPSAAGGAAPPHAGLARRAAAARAPDGTPHRRARRDGRARVWFVPG